MEKWSFLLVLHCLSGSDVRTSGEDAARLPSFGGFVVMSSGGGWRVNPRVPSGLRWLLRKRRRRPDRETMSSCPSELSSELVLIRKSRVAMMTGGF